MLTKSLRFALLICLLSLAACGFHLRGATDVPFKSIHIQGSTLVISKRLDRTLKNNDVKILKSAEDAELQLELIGEESEKRIMSLSGRGVVREYELYYRIHYRTRLAGNELWSAPQTIEARRDFSYEDSQLLAKQAEEKQLNENMQKDVLNNLMRRLSAIRK